MRLFGILCSLTVVACVYGADTTAAVQTGVVKATKLNIRSKPALKGEVVGQVYKGQQLLIVERQEEWLGITAPEETAAWIAVDSITRDGEVLRDVKVMAGPSVSYSSYAELSQGHRVKVLELRGGDWARIHRPDDAVVWVNADFVDIGQANRPQQEPKIFEDKAEEEEAARLAEEARREEEQLRLARERELKEREAQLLEMERIANEQLAKARADQERAQKEQEALATKLRDQERLAKAEAEKQRLAREQRDRELRERLQKLPVHQIAPKVDTTMELEYMSEAHEVEKNGIIRAVGSKEGPWAHAITVPGKDFMYIVAYLKTDKDDLTQWEWKRVRLKGIQRWIKGWPRPQIEILKLEEINE